MFEGNIIRMTKRPYLIKKKTTKVKGVVGNLK